MKRERIGLVRSDLRLDKRYLHIDDITVWDFKSSVISREDVQKADLIVFIENDKRIVFKDRFN